MIDVALLQSTWTTVAGHGDQVAAHFYGRLFLAHPELRPLFPVDMGEQRRKIFATLTLVVRGAGDLSKVAPVLERLGRDHRGFGARPEQFRHVGTALLETLAHFLDDQWTPDVAATWSEAYETVWRAMVDAAATAERAGVPDRWEAKVADIQHDHGPGVVLVDLDVTDYPLGPGQHARLALPDQPGTWITARAVGAGRPAVAVEVPFDPGDPVALRYAALQVGDHVHLGAPLDPVDEGGPDGQPR